MEREMTMEMNKLNSNNFAAILLVVGLGLGFGLSGYFIGDGLYQAKRENRLVTVKGLAEMEVKADIALWSLDITATGNDLNKLRTKITEDSNKLKKFVVGQKLNWSKAEVTNYYVQDHLASGYVEKDKIANRYTVHKSYLVNSPKVKAIKDASQNTEQVAIQGVNLTSNVTYPFTGLNDVKPEMVAEATRNARLSAQKFALDSGSQVGKIRRAQQGVFQILPLHELTYGNALYNIRKKVRLVTTISYELVD